MLICDDTDAKNFPNASGIIIWNQYLSGISDGFVEGTFHAFMTGIRYKDIEAN